MADNIFDRNIINPRERPISSDINVAQAQQDRTLRDLFMRLFLARASSNSDAGAQPITGFLGEALKPRPTNPISMAMRVPAGIGFFYNPTGTALAVGGISGVDDLSVFSPLVLNADFTFSIPNGPSSPNSRIDILEVVQNRHLADPSSRDVLDVTSGAFTPQIVSKTLAWDLDSSIGVVTAPANSITALGYKIGIPGNPGTEPATTPGYVKIGRVLVGSNQTTIDSDSLVDLRKILSPYGKESVSFQVSMPSTGSPVPTLSNVIAPPGYVIVAVGQSTTNSAVNVYVMGGDLTSAIVPNVEVTSINTFTTVKGAASFVTIDSTLQAALNGSNASPATKLPGGSVGPVPTVFSGVGQPVVQIALSAGTPGTPQQYGVSLFMREGF